MQVAMYARVSTSHQHQEGTIDSQVRLIKQYIQQQGWYLLPEHQYLDDGVSGARLDRPALDRLRDSIRRAELDAVVILSPDRLARNYAHQWLLIEEFEKFHAQVIFLQNPFGDTPQGKLLVQMQGMMAEYERAQISERMRRGRLEKARRGEFIPWAYHCYGYRYIPKRHGCVQQVVIEETQAEIIRQVFGWLVAEQMTCRQITKRLNERGISTPSGKNRVWQPATVRSILTNQVYAGTARYNWRQPVLPRYRKTDQAHLRYLKTGRSYRPETEWVLSEAPAIISVELFEKAQLQSQRNADLARRMYQPSSRRYLLRRLVKCGECGLGMVCVHQKSVCKRYKYLYYECKGHSPLSCGRASLCPSRRVRADRLDQVVWQALTQLLSTPSMIPQLHQQWAEAKQLNLSHVTAQHEQLLNRRQRLERQGQRLLDAYQEELISLTEFKSRRQKLTIELQRLQQEADLLAAQQQQVIHWQRVVTNVDTFGELLGCNLERLSFEERQAVAQCLISKIVVTGEDVDIYFVLPFDSPPQVFHNAPGVPEGAPGQFYWLRLAHFDLPSFLIDCRNFMVTQRSFTTDKIHHTFTSVFVYKDLLEQQHSKIHSFQIDKDCGVGFQL